MDHVPVGCALNAVQRGRVATGSPAGELAGPAVRHRPSVTQRLGWTDSPISTATATPFRRSSVMGVCTLSRHDGWVPDSSRLAREDRPLHVMIYEPSGSCRLRRRRPREREREVPGRCGRRDTRSRTRAPDIASRSAEGATTGTFPDPRQSARRAFEDAKTVHRVSPVGVRQERRIEDAGGTRPAAYSRTRESDITSRSPMSSAYVITRRKRLVGRSGGSSDARYRAVTPCTAPDRLVDVKRSAVAHRAR